MTQKNPVVQASSADKIRTLPVVILKGAQLALGREERAEKFIPLVEVDPILTIRVMKAANESAGKSAGQIRSLADAVRTLGLDAVRRTVLETQTLDVFIDHRGNYGLDPVDLWMHSLGTAICARELSRFFEGIDPWEAFLAGLLHDAGKFALATFCAEPYAEAVLEAYQEHVPLHDAESARVRYNHAEVGGWLMDPGGIYPMLTDVIRLHHCPAEESFPDRRTFVLAGLVALSNNLCYSQNIGSGGDPTGAILPPNMFKALGIQRDMIKQAIQLAPLYLREMSGRIDWEPVSRGSFFTALERASRPPAPAPEEDVPEEPVASAHVSEGGVEERTASAAAPEGNVAGEGAASVSLSPRGFGDLHAINSVGLSMMKCDSLETAAGAAASALVGSSLFSRVICCAYRDDQWEYRADALPGENDCACRTELCPRHVNEGVFPEDEDGTWLHVELNGKGRLLGCIKARPNKQANAAVEVLGLLLASSAKIVAQALERIRYQLRVEQLSENLTHQVLWLKQEKQIAETERVLQEKILQSLPFGLVLTGPEGRIAFGNPEARRLLGARKPLVGARIQEICESPDLQEVLASVRPDSGPGGRRLALGVWGSPEGTQVQWRIVRVRNGHQSQVAPEQLLLILEDLADERPPTLEITAPEPKWVRNLRTGTA